jgi:hypothetical protein
VISAKRSNGREMVTIRYDAGPFANRTFAASALRYADGRR